MPLILFNESRHAKVFSREISNVHLIGNAHVFPWAYVFSSNHLCIKFNFLSEKYNVFSQIIVKAYVKFRFIFPIQGKNILINHFTGLIIFLFKKGTID